MERGLSSKPPMVSVVQAVRAGQTADQSKKRREDKEMGDTETKIDQGQIDKETER